MFRIHTFDSEGVQKANGTEALTDGAEALIISWGQHITRSKTLAKSLKMRDVHIPPYLVLNGKGLHVKLINYIVSAFRTYKVLKRSQPKSIVVVLPPSLLLHVAFFYKWFIDKHVVIYADLHNGVLRSEWKHIPGVKTLIKSCDVAIAHNEFVKKSIDKEFGIDSKVLQDPLPTIKNNADVQGLLDSSKINVLVPLSYAKDEPVQEILTAANELQFCNFILTGNYRRTLSEAEAEGSLATFTGYVDRSVFESLVHECDVSLCLTTDSDVQCCAVVESIAANTAIICTDNPVNRELFGQHILAMVQNESHSIVSVITSNMNAIQRRKKHDLSLHEKYSRDWARQANGLFA